MQSSVYFPPYRPLYIYSAYSCINSTHVEPEKKLYLKIIIQLIEDYIVKNPVGVNPKERTLTKAQAKSWFLANSEDYITVCDFAGVNHMALRKIVLNAKPPYKELWELINEYNNLIGTSSV
jgi:hypothetical protein